MIKRKLIWLKDFILSRKTISDEYINWLSFVNAGMLNRGNLYCFDYAIKNLLSTNPVIEIGSFCGLSTNIITYLLNKYKKNNTIFTCDKWIFEGYKDDENISSSNISFKEYKKFVKESYIRNVKMFSKDNLPYTIEEFSDDFFLFWNDNREVIDIFDRKINLGGKISFAYVDGNHTYEYVKRDFENINKNLENNGFVLFDDSGDYSGFGCNKLMKEIKRNKDYKLIIKNPNYLFKKELQ